MDANPSCCFGRTFRNMSWSHASFWRCHFGPDTHAKVDACSVLHDLFLFFCLLRMLSLLLIATFVECCDRWHCERGHLAHTLHNLKVLGCTQPQPAISARQPRHIFRRPSPLESNPLCFFAVTAPAFCNAPLAFDAEVMINVRKLQQ